MARELRIAHNLKQREVAEKIGVKLSSYGNLESSQFKVVGVNKVRRMISLYALLPDRAAELVKAWEEVPLSPYGEKQRKAWERRNAQRSKAKMHDRMQRSLAEVLGLTLVAFHDANDGHVCACAFDREELCEVCMALENLGLDTYTTLDKAIADIAGLQDKLDAQRAAAAAAPSAKNGTAA